MELVFADDHLVLRDALASMLIQAMPGTKIRFAGSGSEALSDVDQSEPDCVLLDINLPGLTGLETARRLIDRRPNLSIICLSFRTELTLISELFSVGVCAYVLKEEEFDALLDAFREVLAGRRYISPSLEALVELPPLTGPGTKKACLGYSALTAKQRDVLARIASGLSMREISSDTGLSTKTLDAHRRRIQQKLGVDSVAELTRIAIREGLVTIEGRPVFPGTLLTNGTDQ